MNHLHLETARSKLKCKAEKKRGRRDRRETWRIPEKFLEISQKNSTNKHVTNITKIAFPLNKSNSSRDYLRPAERKLRNKNIT